MSTTNLDHDCYTSLNLSNNSLHIEDKNAATFVEAEIDVMQLENIIPSTSESIDVYDSDEEIISLSDASDGMDSEDFADIEPCATFSVAGSFPKQEHIKAINVLMMVKIITHQYEKELLIFLFYYFRNNQT